MASISERPACTAAVWSIAANVCATLLRRPSNSRMLVRRPAATAVTTAPPRGRRASHTAPSRGSRRPTGRRTSTLTSGSRPANTSSSSSSATAARRPAALPVRAVVRVHHGEHVLRCRRAHGWRWRAPGGWPAHRAETRPRCARTPAASRRRAGAAGRARARSTTRRRQAGHGTGAAPAPRPGASSTRRKAATMLGVELRPAAAAELGERSRPSAAPCGRAAERHGVVGVGHAHGAGDERDRLARKGRRGSRRRPSARGGGARRARGRRRTAAA